LLLVFLAGLLLLLAGCGEEGGVTTTQATPATTGAEGITTISGTAVKGPVSGGMVTAYAVDNGARGRELASTTTDAQGNFTMKMSGYAGPMMLTMTGGTYQDEATGSMMNMATGDMMTAALPDVSSGATVSGVQMTPLTSMAQTMAGNMSGGMNMANINTANMAMSKYFMVGDVLYTTPMDPTTPNSGAGANQNMKNYGMAMAAMSESAKNLGMTSSSGMVTAMMNDASDGVMNGMMTGSNPVAMRGGMMGGASMMQANTGTSGMASAMMAFMSSGMNRSGLTAADMQALIDQMNSSSGMIGP